MPGQRAPKPAEPAALSDLESILAPYRRRVEAEIARRVPAIAPDIFAKSLADYLARPGPRSRRGWVVYDPIRHVLEAGGKRIRPVLCMVAAEAVGGDAERAVSTAAGLELLHTFTLVHDDVMDNDLTRRGQPTVHALWGPGIAICAGDGLYALAFEAIADNAKYPGVDPEVVVDIVRRAALVSFEICAGQTQDLLFEKSNDVDLEAYEEMIRQKTGVLLAVCVEAGARLGGADADDVAALSEYGLRLGLAFQVKDDLLDLVGTEKEIGKPVGSDIRAGKKTYPVLYALTRLDGAPRARLQDILRAPERETSATMVAEALRILDKCGALAAAEAHAHAHADAAKAALSRVRHVARPDSLRLLDALADYVVRRRR